MPTTQRKSERCTVILLVVSCFILIGATTPLILALLTISVDDKSLTDSSFCIPCRELTKLDETSISPFHVDDNGEVCCAKNGLYRQLIRQFVYRKWLHERPTNSEGKRKECELARPVTYLHLDPAEPVCHELNESRVLQWTSNTTSDNLSSTQTYSNGWLTVTTSGFYTVSSQLSFCRCSPESELRHYVWKRSGQDGSVQVVVEDLIMADSAGDIASSLTAVVRLLSNDSMAIGVSNAICLGRDKAQSLFALVFI